MNNPLPLPFNLNGADPSLSDVLELLRRDIFLEFYCHGIATIQTFNSETQTATASMAYTKTLVQYNSQTGQYTAQSVPYSLLLNCPVVCLGGGYTSLTFPIAIGDECLVLFNDRDIDNWYQGQSPVSPNSTRLHSISDGIIIVGIRSLPNTLDNYDTSRAALQDERGAVVAVGGGIGTKVKIANLLTTLGTILGNLDTALTTFGTALEGATDPVVVSAGTALVTAITAVQVLVGELLE